MTKATLCVVCLLLALHQITAQNTNSSTTPARPRTTNQSTQPPAPKPDPKPAPKQEAAQKPTPAPVPGSDAVVAAFNRLVDGIQTTDVEKVMSVYWKSPSLILFNNNGTV